MSYKEVKEIIDNIVDAIVKGKYDVSYEEPNFIVECKAPDGRTFYKFVDRDDVKSSNIFGGCTVEVGGLEFYCDWGNGDYESSFFDDIEDEYELVDGTIVYKEDLIDKIIDAFNDRDDIFFGEYTDMDWQMEMYAKQNGINNPEYYWCEDDDCPVDITDGWTDYTEPKDLGYGTVYFKRMKYYLVEEPKKEGCEQLHAVHCHETPNDRGRFKTVVLDALYMENGKVKVTACEESDDLYSAVDAWIDYPI